MAIHADRHFDHNFRYYEVTIVSVALLDGYEAKKYSVQIFRLYMRRSIGTGLSHSSHLYSMPGMFANSWGLHSDDGKTFLRSASSCLIPFLVSGWTALATSIPEGSWHQTSMIWPFLNLSTIINHTTYTTTKRSYYSQTSCLYLDHLGEQSARPDFKKGPPRASY